MTRNVLVSSATLGLVLLATGAEAATLPLNAGTYVGEGTACRGAPFATQFSYQAGAFSYPHASQCKSAVVRHNGRTYVVKETCAAEGDGTPAKPDTLTTAYHVLSRDRVVVTKLTGPDRAKMTYRRCQVEVN